MAPSGSARQADRIASSTRRPWPSLPARFTITPATRSAGSKVSKPRTTAAALRAWAQASSTSTTGAPSHFATCAVDPSSLVGSKPSKQPMTPSTTTTSAPVACPATHASTRSRPHIQPSRLYDGRPLARAWKPGSMKSGPTLNAWTESPRRRSASSSPSVIDVFPTPDATPAMTSARMVIADSPRPT